MSKSKSIFLLVVFAIFLLFMNTLLTLGLITYFGNPNESDKMGISKDVRVMQLEDSLSFYRKVSYRYLEHQMNCVEMQVHSTSDSRKILSIKNRAKNGK